MIELTERGKQIRRDTLKLGIPNGIYHYGGSFSVVEILIALYDHILKPEDKVIMSKGHCWTPQLVILRERGLDPGFAKRLDSEESCLVGHPFLDPENGIYANTGSLGHGMPLGVGMALAKKIKGEPGRVYVIVGDGECQEGTFWESLLLANRFRLSNLNVIVDYNSIQGSGCTQDILPMSPDGLKHIAQEAYWRAGVRNGHELDELKRWFNWNSANPSLLVAKTVKGRGVSFMENDPAWHAKYPTPAELEQAYKELA